MSSRPRRILDAPSSASGGEGTGAQPPGPPVPGPPQPRPWVCYALIACAVSLFVAEQVLPISQVVRSEHGRMQIPPLGLYGPFVQAGQYWRLLGAVLEHGSPLHLLFNMSVVVTLGFTLERGIGSLRFFGLSLVTALGASTFSLIFDFDVPTVGASGMILGWAGAMLPVATREGRRDLFIWLAQVAVLSLLPFVSWAGHLGGFLFGLPCGLALRMGRQVYARALPILLFLSVVVALYAAHPERRGGF
ncbi:rhomboid family intramembrane serine protease [Myxococcus xanthus]|uniref:Rhomboid family intramembrane serine protease n=1 Tax=Myxococcus xanthus TaxID=34 RepID=A0AAE6KTR9_MYXXA|nr:rhomboid family intramembrane serine protease [Myxococcus xanthus]QDE76872.1 rhomboid family intramembrane serine protease [Myxococcus xanthus]QDE84260.1 rhomboid family intramembrane serine protease [Myxococcus xanthus]QDE98431.1 rhomboid family intramembrane serine protease [Myxococcus xanthus]QDF06125.1 rhomboid family intramembrane serine protease [Myxococcus xanthus]